jgi:hypothetical protein
VARCRRSSFRQGSKAARTVTVYAFPVVRLVAIGQSERIPHSATHSGGRFHCHHGISPRSLGSPMMSRFLPYQRLRLAARIIRRGGVVAYPTEAVYGLGCDPWDGDAVERILHMKRRDIAKGLILIAADPAQLEPFVEPLSAERMAEIRATWPGPNTWLLPARDETPALAHRTLRDPCGARDRPSARRARSAASSAEPSCPPVRTRPSDDRPERPCSYAWRSRCPQTTSSPVPVSARISRRAFVTGGPGGS